MSAKHFADMLDHRSGKSSSLHLRHGGNSLHIRGSQHRMIGRLQPPRHPFRMAHEQASFVAREHVDRTAQLLEKMGEALAVRRLAEADDLGSRSRVERIRRNDLETQRYLPFETVTPYLSSVPVPACASSLSYHQAR